ncbi:MAG: hypothetical protein ABUT20_26555 [Bacteroidota bacterium]
MKKNSYLLIAAFSFFISCKKERGAAGLISLINVTTIPSGSACVNGGIKIETGLDANGNKILDASEVSASQNVCNGVAGANGHSSLVRTEDMPADDICANGGLKVYSGIDANDNGILEDGEIQQTQEICNGADGQMDKLVIFYLEGGYGATGTTPQVYTTNGIKFNINNYPGIDSAIFVVRHAESLNNGNTINFKLFNLTDNVAFNNSLLSTNSLATVDLQSGNILHDLPNKQIDLGLQLYNDTPTGAGDAAWFYLFLYRK